MDEVSSVFDVGNEVCLYVILLKKLVMYVLVGYWIVLVKYYIYVLEFKDDCSWSFCIWDVFGIFS